MTQEQIFLAIITGLIGAIIGATVGAIISGVITFRSNKYWREQDKKKSERDRFQVSIVHIMDALENLQNLFNVMVEGIVDPEQHLSPQIKMLANYDTPPLYVDPVVLFAVTSDKDKSLFSECSLFLKRHNTTLAAVKAFYDEKKIFLEMASQNKKITNIRDGDLATIEFTTTDKTMALQFARVETLSKDVLLMLKGNILMGRKLIDRLNKCSEMKFAEKPPKVLLTKQNKFPSWLK